MLCVVVSLHGGMRLLERPGRLLHLRYVESARRSAFFDQIIDLDAADHECDASGGRECDKPERTAPPCIEVRSVGSFAGLAPGERAAAERLAARRLTIAICAVTHNAAPTRR